MEFISKFYDFTMNLDENLIDIVQQYGIWVYLFLFAIIFCETGLVVTFFLPGDSLVFVTGALSASGELNVLYISLVMCIAAILGDTLNYHIGKAVGPKIFHKEDGFFFKRKYLISAQDFYERHGGKTIIIARFMPVVRTFAPFVAGMGKMSYLRFLSYNVFGAVLWVTSMMTVGYLFGNIPVVEENFTLVIFGIILISYIPGAVTYIRGRRAKA